MRVGTTSSAPTYRAVRPSRFALRRHPWTHLFLALAQSSSPLPPSFLCFRNTPVSTVICTQADRLTDPVTRSRRRRSGKSDLRQVPDRRDHHLLNLWPAQNITEVCTYVLSALIHRDPDVPLLASISFSRILVYSCSHFAYNSSKGATIHLNRMMSQEWAHTGIRFNTIAPGMFPSEMTTTGSDGKQKSSLKGFNPKSMLIPAERAGEDEDLGGTVLYLSSRAGQ